MLKSTNRKGSRHVCSTWGKPVTIYCVTAPCISKFGGKPPYAANTRQTNSLAKEQSSQPQPQPPRDSLGSSVDGDWVGQRCGCGCDYAYASASAPLGSCEGGWVCECLLVLHGRLGGGSGQVHHRQGMQKACAVASGRAQCCTAEGCVRLLPQPSPPPSPPPALLEPLSISIGFETELGALVTTSMPPSPLPPPLRVACWAVGSCGTAWRAHAAQYAGMCSWTSSLQAPQSDGHSKYSLLGASLGTRIWKRGISSYAFKWHSLKQAARLACYTNRHKYTQVYAQVPKSLQA